MTHPVSLTTPLALRLSKAVARRLGEAGFETVGDLLYYAPRKYYTWGTLTDIGSLNEGDAATVLTEIVSANLVYNRSGKGVRLVVEVTDYNASLTCTFFAKNAYMLAPHQRLLTPGATVLFSGKVGEYRGRKQLVQPAFEELEDTSAEAAARRAGRPIPIYRTVAGLPSWKIGALIRSLLDDLTAEDVPDVIPTNVAKGYALVSAFDALRYLHEPNVAVDWQTAQRTLAWSEALVLQTVLLSTRLGVDSETQRRSHPLLETPRESAGAADISEATADKHEGTASNRGAVTGEVSASALIKLLPFTLTEAQQDAWREIAADLGKNVPMQRLLQADVGAGKTVVALLAMVRAVSNGHQAALLAPTEVLARQHFSSIRAILDRAGIDIPVHLLTAKRAAAEKEAALLSLAQGENGIVIGTHALLSEGVDIPNLALLVVDEQHRFGVAQREVLREGREWTPHLLVMTATPIPRTIAMTVFGDLDVTWMYGLPPGRTPVKTYLVNQENTVWVERIWQRAREEVERGGRVYVVCPRIDADDTQQEGGGAEPAPLVAFAQPAMLVPPAQPATPGSIADAMPAATIVYEQIAAMDVFQGISIELAHGRRKPQENATSFARFASGEAPVLVATTVIEVGVDVPEATMMVILGANRFGLSQLHQLRGRVGRSERESICMLVYPPTENALTQERLAAIAETTDGFVLAEADLRLRKEGDVLGQSQAGMVSGLKFLSVRRDAATITAARQVATALLKADPALTENKALRDAVRARTGDDLVWLERN